MKQVSWCALGLALSLMASAGWAQGQGGGRPGGGRPGIGGRGGFFGGPGGGIAGLLQMPEVQAELKIDDAQKELLQAVNQEMGQKMRQLFESNRGQGGQGGAGRGFSPEMQQKFQALQAEQTKKVSEILDEKQMTRLKQLNVQRAGTRALAQDDVAAQLKLTADQRQKISTIIQGERDSMQSIFQGFRGGDGQRPSDAQREELRKKMTDMRSATDAKLLAVLTDAQKNQFKAMQGAPFKFPEVRGFGGPGGAGGRGQRRRNNN
jgi:Spy/CpxP family protein refolding chaperone